MVSAERAGVLLGRWADIPLHAARNSPGVPCSHAAETRGVLSGNVGLRSCAPTTAPVPVDHGQAELLPPRIAYGIWEMLLCAILGGSGPFLWDSRPRIIDARACARECRRLLDTGELKNAAELALGHRVTPAHVSRLMSLLRLTPEILEYIDGLDGTEDGPHHRPPAVAQRLGCGMCGAGVGGLFKRAGICLRDKDLRGFTLAEKGLCAGNRRPKRRYRCIKLGPIKA